jgi:hypothetical protein
MMEALGFEERGIEEARRRQEGILLHREGQEEEVVVGLHQHNQDEAVESENQRQGQQPQLIPTAAMVTTASQMMITPNPTKSPT